MTVRRPVLRYHGGKWRLAPWIIQHFPTHRIYVEPFGGAASVLLRKERSASELYNDKSRRVVDMFRVLRDPNQAAELCRRIELTPFARDEYAAITPESYEACDDVIERARLFIFRSFAGFGSNACNLARSTGFRANSHRSNSTPAQDWRNYPPVIAQLVDRLRGVVIENREAVVVMAANDTAETLFYVDPPYPFCARSLGNPHDLKYGGYDHELTDDDHRVLAKCLHGLEGMVVLSGYRCTLYDDELFGDWHRVEREALADGARRRTEVLWLNEPAWSQLHAKGPLFEVAVA